MAIDPNIISKVALPTLGDVFAMRANIEQERAAKAKAARDLRLQQEQDDEDAAIKSAFVEAGGHAEQAAQALQAKGYHKAAMTIQGQAAKLRGDVAQSYATELGNKTKIQQGIAQGANGVKDQVTHTQFKQQIAATYGPEAAAGIPDTFDPAWRDATVASASSIQEQRLAQKAAADALRDWPKDALAQRTAIAEVMASADDPDEWNAAYETLKLYPGVTPQALAWVPKVYSPDARTMMQRAALTQKEANDKANTETDNQLAADRLAHDRARLAADMKKADQDAKSGTEADRVLYRQAVDQREDELTALSRARRGKKDPYGEEIEAPWTAAEVAEEEERINAAFRRRVGLPALPPPADNPSLPRGVRQYLQDIKAKIPTLAHATAELNRHLPEQRRVHPNLNEEAARAELASLYPGETLTSPPPAVAAAPAARPNAMSTPPVAASGLPSTYVRPPAAAPARGAAPQINTIRTLKDGTRIKILAIDTATGKITRYEVVK